MQLSPREIKVHLLNAGPEYPPGGVGEPGTPPFAPAL
jgi:isoquinoline 1-oxidoreductase beta subunit